MGIIPLFYWGEAKALFLMGKFTLVNKPDRGLEYLKLLKKVLRTLSSMINAFLISYSCVFKPSSKPVMKRSRVIYRRSEKRIKNGE